MRLSFVIFALASSSLVAQAQAPPADQKTEAERSAEAEVVARKAAEAYRMIPDELDAQPLKLEPKSLLKWSSPVNGSFHGSIFLWTAQGKPAVIASISKKFMPLPTHLALEFHSLTAVPVKAEREGQADWASVKSGVEYRPLPDSTAPADSPARRLRQMRTMAEEFTASKTTRDNVTRSLRLLTQPIYRYESTDPKVTDGAIFAFVEGTDPEVVLLMEARAGEKGPEWQYALARMNSTTLKVDHKGREVWSVSTLSWPEVQRTRQPYSLLIFNPGQGLNKTEPTSK